jgi:hypothetical protein
MIISRTRTALLLPLLLFACVNKTQDLRTAPVEFSPIENHE